MLNSARESNISTDIAHIVRTEVLPLRPDLVVYYEGGNQFRPASIVPDVPKGAPQRPPGASGPVAPEWLRAASRWSALAGRLQAAIGLAASDMDGKEWPKPDYKVVWPSGLDEQDPDLDYPNLPVSLNLIERDLDQIRGDLSGIGAEFALSSFAWMVKDGLVLDPVRHRYIIEQLNVSKQQAKREGVFRVGRAFSGVRAPGRGKTAGGRIGPLRIWRVVPQIETWPRLPHRSRPPGRAHA